MDDLKEISSDLHRSLEFILKYNDDDFEKNFGDWTFEITSIENGRNRLTALKPGGGDITLTRENRFTFKLIAKLNVKTKL